MKAVKRLQAKASRGFTCEGVSWFLSRLLAVERWLVKAVKRLQAKASRGFTCEGVSWFFSRLLAVERLLVKAPRVRFKPRVPNTARSRHQHASGSSCSRRTQLKAAINIRKLVF